MAGDNDKTTNGRGPDAAPAVEPDYRVSLANERIFLAWQRTALGLLAAAVAVEFVPALRIPGTRHVLGVVLAVMAILTAGVGLSRWKQIDRGIRSGMPLPRHPTPVYLGAVLIVTALLIFGFVLRKLAMG